MSARPNRYIVFGLLGVVGLCLIGLGVSVYRAKAMRLKDLRAKLSAKQTELNGLQERIQRQPLLEAEYASLQRRLSVLEPALPESEYIPTFLQQLQKLATDTNNDILMIRPMVKAAVPAAAPSPDEGEGAAASDGANPAPGRGKKAEKPPAVPYDQAAIEVKLMGTYQTMVGFLEELRRFPKMIAVNEVAFSPQSGPQSPSRNPRLEGTFELTAVVTKDSRSTGNAGAASAPLMGHR
jgi:hypothetical protein